MPAGDVNPGRDLAFCRPCGEAFALSALLRPSPQEADVRPVPGAWFRRTPDGFTAGATARNLITCYLVPVTVIYTAVWSSVGLGGLAAAAERAEPPWFFFAIMVPFAIASLGLVALCVHLTVGRVEIRVERGIAEVVSGVGGIGRRRRFRWPDVESASEEVAWGHTPVRHEIVLKGARRIALGVTLRDERRYFLLRAIQRMLAERT